MDPFKGDHRQQQLINGGQRSPIPPSSSSRCPSMAASTSSSPPPRVHYIYDLPYNHRKHLCDLLDADQSWRQLGGQYVGLSETSLTLISHALLRNGSPTNELLKICETSNTRINQLFIYLAQMGHKRALYILRQFVDEKLRQLCPEEDPDNDDNNDYNRNNTSDFDAMAAALAAVSTNGLSKQKQNNNSFFSDAKGLPQNSTKYVSTKLSTEKKILNNKNLNDLNTDYSNKSKVLDMNMKKKTTKNKTMTTTTAIDNNFNCDTNNDSNKRNNNNKSLVDGTVDEMEVHYKELLIATDDFAKERILGNGGFGTVYKGEWKGTNVAIKRLKGFHDISQALTELKVLNRYRIDNILPIYGVSLDGAEPCLVYQFMPNGSLEDRLLCKANTRPLSWPQRINIGEGVARALNYLHTLKGNAFVHGDVKSANILLDSLFEPKLGDFGLARQVNPGGSGIYTHCTVSAVHGTSVYLPFEYLRQKILSPAVDVYSYGIVLLEMATGKRAFDGKRLLIDFIEDHIREANKESSDDYTKLLDKRIADGNESCHWFDCLLDLGRKCAHRSKNKRPPMIQILEYYNQYKTSERIRRLSAEAYNNKNTVSGISKSIIKTPLELQLWYDMVRKTGGDQSETCCPTVGTDVNVDDFDGLLQSNTQMNDNLLTIDSNENNNINNNNVFDDEDRDDEEERDVDEESTLKPIEQNANNTTVTNNYNNNNDDITVPLLPLITELGVSSNGDNNSIVVVNDNTN